MKKYFISVLILVISASCGKGDDGGGDTGPQPQENALPSVPTQVYPLNNTLCINNNVSFEWQASTDADDDVVSYVVEVSENSTFDALAFTSVSFSTAKLISLQKGKSYYWRLKARDSKNGESGYSSVSQFLTEGDGVSNHLPYAPELVAPKLHAAIDGTSTTLSWTASDVDNDALTYDVYLDHTILSPTTKVSSNQTETTYAATGLEPSKTYYFKVVAKDDKGGATVGQVWRFITK